MNAFLDGFKRPFLFLRDLWRLRKDPEIQEDVSVLLCLGVFALFGLYLVGVIVVEFVRKFL